MLKNIIIVTSLFISSGYALSLDEMMENVLKNNHDLKSLEKSIELTNKQIDISTNWKNPTISFGANDIYFDDPFKRDQEAMQAQYIGYSQVIPMGDKLDIKKEISQRDKNIATFKLEDKKLQLKSKIYEYAYNIVILEKKYTLLNKYLKNIKSLEELSNALYENGKMRQNDIINLKISYSKIILKQKNLKNLINNLYLKLENITYSSIDKIDLTLNMNQKLLTQNFDTHPKILLTKEKSLKFDDVSRFELAKKTSDIKFNIAYFQRDDKFKDYANISVNIPLAIYDTEKTNALKARLKSQEIKNNLTNLSQTFNTQVLMYQNDIDNSKQRYNIIKNTIIPLKQEVQTNIESYNSFSQITPQDAIKNLNDLISYEMMLLDEIKKQFTSYSKSIYFTQGNI